MLESGGVKYSFTLRRSEDVELGLEVDPKSGEQGEGLRVKGVARGSAIESWNNVCDSGPAAGKEVTVGDRVISVNGQTEPEVMLGIFKSSTLLKFVVVRGGDDNE